MLRCLGGYLLRLVTRSYNDSDVQPSHTIGRQSHYVDVRRVVTRHVNMLYVGHETYQCLSRSVVSRFRLVEAVVEHIEEFELVKVVKVLDFVKV